MKLIRLLLGCGVSVALLYSYVDEQNKLTRLRLEIPLLATEVKAIQEENIRLRYEIDLFESPEHLMQLAAKSSFSHLKHPIHSEILFIAQGKPLEQGEILPAKEKTSQIRTPLASTL